MPPKGRELTAVFEKAEFIETIPHLSNEAILLPFFFDQTAAPRP
jgi:hypothetical protein